MKKERPILMSAPMVLAILEGRKTQTRRKGKCQMDKATELGVEYSRHATKGDVAVATYRAYPDGGSARWGLCECPYGIPGDRLWVRETFQFVHANSDGQRNTFKTSVKFTVHDYQWIEYAATPKDNEPPPKWKPSIFMPRWASRITLEIVKVRVERLQEITTADIQKEGVVIDAHHHLDEVYLAAYCLLWESINGKDSWSKNPWVWVIEFKRIL
jgi:hypothetical protein